jgi:Flp pilus assembly secretin CpaC
VISRDNEDRREALMPQVEETVYLPGVTGDKMQDLANLARQVFDLKQVTASGTNGFLLVRGDEKTLQLLNATYADMLDGGSDVLFDVNLYELDTTHIVNVGAQLPSSANVFSVQQEAQTIVNNNQTLLDTLLSSGQLNQYLTTNQTLNTYIEALALIQYAGITDSNITGLLKFLGTVNGIPLAGLSVSGSSTMNLSLNATDSRLLDAVKLRASGCSGATCDPVTFRAGERYPVVTGTYSSGVSSSLASSLSGLNVNGTSVSSLLSQYLGASTVSVPQFQFEDLGLTLELKPHVQRGNQVNLALNLKLEALGGTSINNIPILNNRVLTSTITIPDGDTAMLAAFVSRNEIGSIDGLPGLSELPGFQGTDRDSEKDTQELLITITPHVIRTVPMHIASRRLDFPHPASGNGPSQ